MLLYKKSSSLFIEACSRVVKGRRGEGGFFFGGGEGGGESARDRS